MAKFEIYTDKDSFVKKMLKKRGIPQGIKILVMSKKQDYPAGRISKIPEKMKIMMEYNGESYDFLIEIAEWIIGSETPQAKPLEEAIIMHEIWHLEYDEEKEKVYLRDHEIEDFPDVIQEYGNYYEALEHLEKIYKKKK